MTDSHKEFYRVSDLIRGVVPFSVATLHRRIADGSFPAGVLVSPRVRAWPAQTIEEWKAKVSGEGTLRLDSPKPKT